MRGRQDDVGFFRGTNNRSAGRELFWIVFLFVSAFTISGCASQAVRPSGEATSSSRTDRYASSQYIVGTGCVAVSGDAARDRLAADQAARAEVAKQIEVKVVQLVEDIQKEEKQDERIQESYAISIKTQELVDRSLKGVKIVERETKAGEGLQCSKAVLDKAAMASRIRDEVDALRSEANAYITGAEEVLAASRPAGSLRNYALALRSLGQAAVEANLIQDLGYKAPLLPSRVDIQKKWLQTLQEINILPVGGDRQKGRAGEPLAEPLKVRVLYGTTMPVPNLPLIVLRKPEKLDMQTEAVTDSGGEAAFLVFRVVSKGKALEEIAVGIDWGRLLQTDAEASEEEPWKDWEKREAVFTYFVPFAGDYRVGVAVYEDGTGRPMANSPVQAALLEGLQKAGFKTQDVFSMSRSVAQSFRQKPTIEQARRILGDRLDILLLGEVSLVFSSRSNYDFIFYRARGMVQGIGLSSGRVLATLDAEAKGGGLDEGRAAKKAIENLGKTLRKEIGPKLERSLE